ncbi:MAG: glycoside hydrolase family 43 protein [Actinomycetota bacterium]
MRRRSPLLIALLLGLLATACGQASADDAQAARIVIVEPPTSLAPTTPVVDPALPTTTTTSAPVTTVPATTTTVPEATASAADRPLSGGTAFGAAAGRIASDGTPTFDGDFADPFLLMVDGDIYAYATNTFFMNVPTLAAYGDGGGELAGDALPELPAWSEPGHVWAPAVTAVDDGYVLHYTTRHSASGRQCISVAVGDSSTGPFVDDSDEPLVCTLDLGGSIDPSTIEVDGELWLLWKSDGNCCGIATRIYAQPLSEDGTELAGDAVELIRNDLSWERDVVEGPSMIEVDGEFHLFYSANRWDTEAYAVGHAVCETVTGPCVKDPEPWLADTEATSGPGGLEVMEVEGRPVDFVVYHGWTGDDVGYDEGQRSLYARPIRWVDGEPELVERGNGA